MGVIPSCFDNVRSAIALFKAKADGVMPADVLKSLIEYFGKVLNEMIVMYRITTLSEDVVRQDRLVADCQVFIAALDQFATDISPEMHRITVGKVDKIFTHATGKKRTEATPKTVHYGCE